MRGECRVMNSLGGVQSVQLERGEAPDAPVALVVPAMGIGAGYYREFSRVLSRRGWNVMLGDLPGQGKSPLRPDRARNWTYGDVVRDHLGALAKGAAELFPGAPRIWIGHSLGGQLALLRAGAFPGETEGVVLIASGSPHYRAWPGHQAGGILLFTQLGGLLGAGLGHFPGHRLGFGGRQPRSLIGNWAQVGRTGSFRFADFDGDAALRNCVAPVLAIQLEGDGMAPKASLEELLGRVASTQVRRVLWSSADGAPHHNRWPRSPHWPARAMDEWVSERRDRRPG